MHDVKVVSEGDAAEFPSISAERSVALAEPDRLQLGQPLAAAGAAEEDRRLVVEQLAAAVGEDGWPIDQARPLLLAAAGGGHLTRRLFRAMVQRTVALTIRTG